MSALRTQVRQLVFQTLRLDDLAPADLRDDEPLFGGRLALDSVDALELLVAVEKAFGISFGTDEVGHEALASIAALATFVESRLARAAASPAG